MSLESIIFHIDVNSAFLSWEAAYQVNELGASLDIRDIPSIIGGSQENRHGIVLAKSSPAKKYHIQTGEPVASARKKCPGLTIVPPNYPLYVDSSRRFIEYLKKFTPDVEPYSIDEVFCDFTGMAKLYGSPIAFAHQLKDLIKKDLGFTVNIGVSHNRLLAKMASDFEKPDKVHTLFPEEIPLKMWPLDIRDLFFVGHASEKKLRTLGIHTIGELAHADKTFLTYHLKKHGELIWDYANGIDHGQISKETPVANKGYGNSTTISFDVTDPQTAKMVLLSLCETVGTRLRNDRAFISVVSISITDHDFHHGSHQRQLLSPTNVTSKIYEIACELFDEYWDHTPIRQLGVQTSRATNVPAIQINLFDTDKYDKLAKLDQAIDTIRTKYGEDSVKRARFLEHEQPHMAGGLHKSKRTGITKGVTPDSY
ncbi:MAG: DNA polymerase IV [Lachnospiraceae bacterium]